MNRETACGGSSRKRPRSMRKNSLGLGGVSLTAPFYVYRIRFFAHDIPKLRHSPWITEFGRSVESGREMRTLAVTLGRPMAWR